MKAQRWMARVGVILGIAVFGLAPTSMSQECPEYVGVMEVEMWPSSPSQVQISGSYAYLGGPSFLSIIDVADLEGPRVVGRIPVPGDVTDLSVAGNRVFFISEWCGGKFPRGPSCYRRFHIADVSYPDRPQPMWMSEDLDFSPIRIAVSGDRFFIASTDGLRVFDVTDPADPVEVGFHASEGEPSDLVVEGGLAYVALPESGLRIIDVSDSATPVEVGSWEASWEALDLEVLGGFAYVADGSGGLRVIDVTNPAEPTEIGIMQTDADVLNVSVAGSVAMIGLAFPRVVIVDISDPTNPARMSPFITEGPALDVALTGNTAFVVTGSSEEISAGEFQVLDLSVPDSPIKRGSFEFRSSVVDLEMSNAVLYAATGDTGLYVLDQSNPDEIIEGFFDTPGFAFNVTLHNGLALVGDDYKGLLFIDVSDPANMVEVGFIDIQGQARRVSVAGDYAYVADRNGSLRIIDISIPEAPVEVAVVGDFHAVKDIAVEGGFAYVAEGGGLRVFDVSDPVNPVLVTSKEFSARRLAVKDQVLYLAGSTQFYVCSLQDPSNPRVLSWGDKLSNWPTDITVLDDRAYVSTEEGHDAGLEIFDIQNLYFPSRIGRWISEGDAFAVEASNRGIYLAEGKPEIVMFDGKCLTTYWVEIVTHNSGFHGSEWRSDVFISHEAERTVGIDFILHTVDGEFTAETSVDAGHQGVFEDIVGLLGYEGKGALEIRATYPITVSSRVYNETEAGTHGSFIQGYQSSGCSGSGKLYGLREVEGKFRTNISVTNTTDETREVWIALYRTDGFMLIRYSIDVGPGMVVQEVRPYEYRRGRSNIDWGFATIDGGEGILACATVIDSRTNDAVIVPLLP